MNGRAGGPFAPLRAASGSSVNVLPLRCDAGI
jgi:hypothetical protein